MRRGFPVALLSVVAFPQHPDQHRPLHPVLVVFIRSSANVWSWGVS
jgi:hypothetical protein